MGLKREEKVKKKKSHCRNKSKLKSENKVRLWDSAEHPLETGSSALVVG